MSGITYLSYLGHSQRVHATPAQQLQLFHPVVQKRLQTTMAYFSGSLFATGVGMFALRNSRLAMMNPWALFFVSLGAMFGTHMCDYETNFAMKNLMYAGFIGSMTLSLVPLVHIYAAPIIYDAMLATGFTVGSLGLVAYNAPSEQFLNWGGPLAIGLGAMFGVSVLSMLYPGSPALYNIYLYGGLALFSAMVLYDTQQILYKAKTQKVYDPISSTISVYLDTIQIFVRFVQILGNSKKK